MKKITLLTFLLLLGVPEIPTLEAAPQHNSGPVLTARRGPNRRGPARRRRGPLRRILGRILSR